MARVPGIFGEGMDNIEIAHLCIRPGYAAGSVNRTVAKRVCELNEFKHLMISFDGETAGNRFERPFLIIGGKGQRLPSAWFRAIPTKWRARFYSGMTSPEHIQWCRAAKEVLEATQPRVIASYDHYKLGRWLRSFVRWPCRLVFAQHGYSYFVDEARGPYHLDSFDAVVLLSWASYRFDRARLHAYEPSVEVIPNPVDLNIFKPARDHERIHARDALGLPRERKVVVTVGRQVPKKGAHILVEAWGRIVGTAGRPVLWIVGPIGEEYREYVCRIAANLGIAADIRIEGAVSPERVSEVLSAADLFAFPSLCHEGMALSLCQAIASGLPCVASRSPSTEESLEGSLITWVDYPNDATQWAERISEALGSPWGLEEIQAQRAWAEKRLSASTILDRWREFYSRQLRLAGG